MFGIPSKKSYSTLIVNLAAMLLFVLGGLTACDSEPPQLVKAVKQFESEEALKNHMSHIRKDHMDLLRHKRDLTMIKGIRTKENSLKACINCHVPAEENGKVIRHDNPKHFCSTCHGYVAASLDCFECHADHPLSDSSATAEVPNDSIHNNKQSFVPTTPDQAPVEVAKRVNTDLVTGESTSE